MAARRRRINSMTPSRQKLVEILTLVQNSARYQRQDIVTLTMFMWEDAEVVAHIVRHAEPLPRAEIQAIADHIAQMKARNRAAA
jgi:hypothetical protein